MKKKRARRDFPIRNNLLKIVLIMKTTVFFLLIFISQLSASVYSQQTKLKVDFKQATIKEVIDEIEGQTDLTFFFSGDVLNVNQRITLKAKSISIDNVLELVGKQTGLSLTVVRDQILVKNMASHNGFAQQPKTISGKASDTNGQPLPGVTVVIKGTAQGTITDADGRYSLPGIPPGTILQFSFVGMRAQEIAVENKTVIDVVMEEDVIGLEEVIAVGYGTVKKSDLTGSVSRMTSEKISKISPTQITETLAGTVAGLYSTQNNSASGGGSLELRGPSSISAETEPLIVLDGAIYSGGMSEINPTDIETIDILKDASSAAIYGSRAAAGVIIVTTKRGKKGKPTINFSARTGISTTTNDFYPYGMDPDGDPMDYFNMHRDLLYQMKNGAFPYYYYWRAEDLPSDISGEEWLAYVDNPNPDATQEWFNRLAVWPVEQENYLAGETTNFYDLCIGTGLRQDYNLGVSGATDNLSYYWSVGYLNNEGIIKGDKFSTIRTRFNIDLKVTDWLKVGTNTHFSYRDEGGVQASLSALGQMSPYGSMWNEDGSLRSYPNDYTLALNPLADYYGRDRIKDTYSLFSNIFSEIKFPFGITYRISFQPSLSFLKDFNYYSTDTDTGSNTYTGGYGYRINTNTYRWMFDNLIKWKKVFGVHDFDLTFLVNAEKYQSWSSEQYASDFSPNENLIFHALQFGANQNVYDDDQVSTGDALMARLNYTLMDKYLFTVSVRRDGYSAFGQENPRGTFPAFAFAWKINEESFYHSSFMNRLKFRMSWGQNGNREIGAYSALAQLGSVQYYDGGSTQTGVYNTTLANPNLSWERTESFNIGVDIGLFDNRIDMSLDAYVATTKDLLLERKLPDITGFSSIMSNLGKLGNKGIEATINTINISHKDFSWRSSLVFSLNRNKIKELWGDYGSYTLLNKAEQGELPDFENEWFPGYALDAVWDYDRLGIWQMAETEEAAKYELEPGDYKVDDVNGDYEMTQVADKKFIGHTTPRYRLGFTNEFSFYENFTASIFIRADIGHIREVPITGNRTTHDRRNDWSWGYWSPENPGCEFQKNDSPDNTSRFGGGIIPYVPTGFLRVQDLTLAYSVPSEKIQRILSIQGLSLLLSGRNLLTFTNWPGFDPENSDTAPMPKTITFGVDISL